MEFNTLKVPVVFEVGFIPASEDHIPCLVGSLKELGTWNRFNGLVAKKIDEDTTKWSVELEIPKMSFFFFKWALTKNGQFYEEEPTGCRKANVGVFGGVFTSEYGKRWTEFSSFCGCQILISTHYVLNYDEQIVVMGSGKLLGNWKTWVPAASDDPATSVWTAKFELEQGTTEEIKWVILDKQTREIRRWQEGENRIIKIEIGLMNKSVFLPWGGRFVKEGLIIPVVAVGDWSDYHSQRLSRSFDFDCMIGYDDDEIETNNSNMEDTKHAWELVPKISSLGSGQKVTQTLFKATSNTERKLCFTIDLLAGAFGSKEVTEFNLILLRNLIVPRTSLRQVRKAFTKEQSLPCFTVDLLAEVSCLKELITGDVILQLQLTSLAVTGPLPEINLYIEDEMQLELLSFQNDSNLLKPSPEESRTSSPAAKFYFNHDRTIVSRAPILDNDTDLERAILLIESPEFIDRVVFLNDSLDLTDRVAVLYGSLDQGDVEIEMYEKMDITYSDDMVKDLQSTQEQVVVETNTDQDWSELRKALYSVFTGLSNFCSRFVF